MTHLGKFRHKFGTSIKQNSLWKWVMSKPSFLVNICNFCSRFIEYLCHLEPACGRIDHCEAPQFKRVFPFQGIVYGPMRSKNSASQGFVSAWLGGSLPYFWLVVFALWHVGHFLFTSWTVVWRSFQSKCWQRVCYVQVSPKWQSISWYQSTVLFCSAAGKHIFLFWHIKRCFWSPPWNVSRV